MVCGTMKTSKTKMMLLGWEMSHWIRVFAAHTRKPEFGSLEPVQTVGTHCTWLWPQHWVERETQTSPHHELLQDSVRDLLKAKMGGYGRGSELLLLQPSLVPHPIPHTQGVMAISIPNYESICILSDDLFQLIYLMCMRLSNRMCVTGMCVQA